MPTTMNSDRSNASGSAGQPGPPFTALVLAAQRRGQVDPLAIEAGVTHKCMVPIAGKPLMEHVLRALARAPSLTRIVISIEPEVVEAARQIPGGSGEFGIPVDYVPSASNIADSVYAAAEGVEGHLVITTADNVNLSPEAIEQILQPIRAGSPSAIGLASRSAVLEVRDLDETSPVAARVGPYRFADGRYSNCNLYAFADASTLKLAEAFREGGQFSKNKGRLVRVAGILNVLLYASRLLTMERAVKRLGRRLGFDITPVVLDDGAQAVDVDNPASYKHADAILRKRGAAA